MLITGVNNTANNLSLFLSFFISLIRGYQLDLLRQKLMDKPSIETPFCPFCGKAVNNRHHIVPRSDGGKDSPTVTVCGMGNASGCHGKFHHYKLHLRWNDGWEYLETDEPTKYQTALEMDGWQRLKWQ